LSSITELDLDPDVTIGVALPMDYSDEGGFFPGTQTALTQTSSNIKNLLLTNKGERVGQPDFGCGLLKVLFEPMSDSLIDNLQNTIIEAMNKWLPHVLVNKLEVLPDEVNENMLIINIEFSLQHQPTMLDELTLQIETGGGY
tara:strand:- start:1517 stop:1942 length:426 start_codon:yes stop_codon:yes gene_type:complete